jgi:hypothetical protein
MSEGDYVDKICKGSIEYTLDNKTRVDCQLANEQKYILLNIENLITVIDSYFAQTIFSYLQGEPLFLASTFNGRYRGIG